MNGNDEIRVKRWALVAALGSASVGIPTLLSIKKSEVGSLLVTAAVVFGAMGGLVVVDRKLVKQGRLSLFAFQFVVIGVVLALVAWGLLR